MDKSKINGGGQAIINKLDWKKWFRAKNWKMRQLSWQIRIL